MRHLVLVTLVPLFFNGVSGLGVTGIYVGKPSKGEIWPQPQFQLKHNVFYLFDPSAFKVNITDQTCDLLNEAVSRYVYTLKILVDVVNRFNTTDQSQLSPPQLWRERGQGRSKGYVSELMVELTAPCEQYPHYGMDEVYYLNVTKTPHLRSASIWGILRGLESFSQLFYISDNFKEIRINKTEILDYPRFAHRGLLIDTSRHYISLPNIYKTLDAMAMNKMNVLHWHIVDDQSFPYQSEKFPELSARGAYHPTMIYQKSDIQSVIKFAQARGIRVIPEFDVPGHTYSWGAAYPNLLTECYDFKNVVYGFGPMNPIKNVTYKLLRELFHEVQELFVDKYFHIGGDEVDIYCWITNPEIKAFMKHHNITEGKQLHALFMQKAIPLLKSDSTPIVWQEVFDEGVPLSNDTLVQIWKGEGSDLVKVVRSGHKALFSSSWYLDHLGDEFHAYYTKDPRQMVIDITNNEHLADMVVGGEACMWGEMVDNNNFLSRIWPRASAVAERLWSAGLGQTKNMWQKFRIPDSTYHRLEEHSCRMIRRGIPAEPPIGPGFCIA